VLVLFALPSPFGVWGFLQSVLLLDQSGIGGAGGGAAWGFATVQSVAMTTFMSAKIGALAGAAVGVAKAMV
jgi:hypothetical protein